MNKEHKVCKKCGKSDRRANGRCRQCCASANAAYYAANKEKCKAAMAIWKSNNPDRVKEYKSGSSKYRKNNPEKSLEYNRAYRVDNKESLRISAAEWHKRNKEKSNARSIAWAAENPERMRKLIADWVKANPEKRRIYDHNNRARRRKAQGRLSKGLADKLFKLQRGKCACCGKPLGDDYHLDHIMPLALGGTNTDDNIQLLTAACNLKKHAKHPVDFMQEKGFLI